MIRPVIRPSGLIVSGKKILLLRYRYGNHDRFNLPGGNLEGDESLLDCLIREFNEELNLTVTPKELLYVAETRTDKTTVHLVFRMEHRGEPCLNPDQVRASELLWLPACELIAAPLYPAIGSALAAWLKESPQPVHLGRIEQPWFPN
ncbi:MAG: NUDIX hydrolase [Magnetococcus sp. YQC-9]